ncbi:MAG TPA: tRNA epoxyqueuosine(34) reductase QueG [Sphingomonadales bacterium]|nr:tRNA epoxyqueuosine(34) reductase QueG [Sphingomonadales bacterium]
MTREEAIREKALQIGFDAVGFTAPERMPPGRAEQFKAFLENGWHGEMTWLAEKAGRRVAPLRVWSEVRGIVMVALNYAPRGGALDNLNRRSVGNLSVYARGRDYHDLMKARLKALGRWIHETYTSPVKVFVDTAPVMEKPLAEAAGIGWQGKHTNLVSRAFGSWLFLGTVFTALEVTPGEAHKDHCGGCRACLDVCPTRAFPAPYQLDARRCISYLTIEHKGPIPHEFREAVGNRVYGCDDCLAVCPWNKYAKVSRELAFFAREDLQAPPLARLLALDDAAFRRLFSKSPVKRTGRDRFVRNALIAAGNSNDKSLKGPVEKLLADSSALVRGAAAWAFQRLAEKSETERARAQGLEDSDASVRAEWAA